MSKPIVMPKFEMAQETGTVGRWLKQAGDTVRKGEPVLEIETDKITMEVESPANGVLTQISAQPGDVVPIGTVIAQVLLPGESVVDQTPAPRPVALPVENSTRITPVAQRMATAHGVDANALTANGGRVTKTAVENFLAQQNFNTLTESAGASATSSVLAVPAARRLARELGIDLAQITGSGPDGRIQSHDVQKVDRLRSAATDLSGEKIPDRSRSTKEAQPLQPALRRIVPLTTLRRTIAERLTASWRNAPQFTLSLHVEMSRAQQVIDEVRAADPAVAKVTVTAFLVKACAWALLRHPSINAALMEDGIHEWADVNIGVAVATEGGLLVPVIRHANQLSLGEVATRLGELSGRARIGKLSADDLQGGTFTISNLGMFGVEQFTAIINPPQAAILAVGKTIKQVVVTEDEHGRDQTVIKPLANFTLSADHRVVDGAVAGRFLADLKKVVESPGLLL